VANQVPETKTTAGLVIPEGVDLQALADEYNKEQGFVTEAAVGTLNDADLKDYLLESQEDGYPYSGVVRGQAVTLRLSVADYTRLIESGRVKDFVSRRVQAKS
jgi:arabinogalactan endo-1,4-beta-galactosidase